MVDTQGLRLVVAVHPADLQDRDGAKLVISKLTGRFPRLSLIWADGGYAGKLIEWVATLTGWTLEIVRRPGNSHRFQVLPRRWVVERTFAWLGRHRRLSKDYEALPETTEAWVYTAMTGLMLRRLARPLFKHPLTTGLGLSAANVAKNRGLLSMELAAGFRPGRSGKAGAAATEGKSETWRDTEVASRCCPSRSGHLQ